MDAAVAAHEPDAGYVELDDCPLDSTEAHLTAVFGGITGPTVNAAAAVFTESGIFDIGGGFGPMVACDRHADEGPESVGLFALAAPADLVAYAEYFANPDGIDRVGVVVDPTRPLGAGMFHQMCGFDTVDPKFDFREVESSTDDVVVGVYVSGSVARHVDRVVLETGLAAGLPEIIADFATRVRTK